MSFEQKILILLRGYVQFIYTNIPTLHSLILQTFFINYQLYLHFSQTNYTSYKHNTNVYKVHNVSDTSVYIILKGKGDTPEKIHKQYIPSCYSTV